MPTGTLFTIDDFELLPDEVAENHELVDGVLVDVSGNTPLHNRLRDYLIFLMIGFLRDHPLGIAIAGQEYDFLGNAHGPAVTFFGTPKVSLVNHTKRVQRFVPDLAIEIASPSNTYVGMLIKKDRYLRAGTQEVWLISPETHEVTIFYSSKRPAFYQSGDTVNTELLPEFSVTLDDLFQGL